MSASRLKQCFITWHYQARSRNLARLLGIPLHELEISGEGIKRHFGSAIWTVWVLMRHRPRVIYLQYSFLLLVVLALYKLVLFKRVTLICDCHTKALRRRAKGPFSGTFMFLKRWSFNFADLVIVTNQLLVEEAKVFSKGVMILPDPIPEWDAAKTPSDKSAYCVFISSFAVDEPLENVMEAARLLSSEIKVYWTGRIPESSVRLVHSAPSNVEFTSYLEYREYMSLLGGARVVLVLTTEEGCLLSGAYEALAAGTPMVLSDTASLRLFFGESAVYCSHHPETIAEAIRRTLSNYECMRTNVLMVKERRQSEFRLQFQQLLEITFAIRHLMVV